VPIMEPHVCCTAFDSSSGREARPLTMNTRLPTSESIDILEAKRSEHSRGLEVEPFKDRLRSAVSMSPVIRTARQHQTEKHPIERATIQDGTRARRDHRNISLHLASVAVSLCLSGGSSRRVIPRPSSFGVGTRGMVELGIGSHWSSSAQHSRCCLAPTGICVRPRSVSIPMWVGRMAKPTCPRHRLRFIRTPSSSSRPISSPFRLSLSACRGGSLGSPILTMSSYSDGSCFRIGHHKNPICALLAWPHLHPIVAVYIWYVLFIVFGCIPLF
jgi:hypothetical protein